MAGIRDKNDLEVYRLAMDIAEDIWRSSKRWRRADLASLRYQITRSADSIAANIGEGFGRHSFKENIHFCRIARGSLEETSTWLDKARNRSALSKTDYERLTDALRQTHRALNGYIRYLRIRSSNQPKTRN